MTSPKYLCTLTAALLLAGLPLAHGETLVPLQGQTQQQIQADIAACQSSADAACEATDRADSSAGFHGVMERSDFGGVTTRALQ